MSEGPLRIGHAGAREAEPAPVNSVGSRLTRPTTMAAAMDCRHLLRYPYLYTVNHGAAESVSCATSIGQTPLAI